MSGSLIDRVTCASGRCGPGRHFSRHQNWCQSHVLFIYRYAITSKVAFNHIEQPSLSSTNDFRDSALILIVLRAVCSLPSTIQQELVLGVGLFPWLEGMFTIDFILHNLLLVT